MLNLSNFLRLHQELKKYLSANQDKFTEVNYLNDSRCLIICPETKQLFGEDVKDSKTGYAMPDTTTNPLSSYVKEFILGVNGISEEMRTWANKKTSSKQKPIQNTQEETKLDDDAEMQNGTEERNYEDFIPLMPNKFSYPSTIRASTGN